MNPKRRFPDNKQHCNRHPPPYGRYQTDLNIQEKHCSSPIKKVGCAVATISHLQQQRQQQQQKLKSKLKRRKKSENETENQAKINKRRSAGETYKGVW